MRDSEQSIDRDGMLIGEEILLNASRPDLYRLNAFRVMELPIDATTRDFSRQIDIMTMLIKHGIPREGRGSLPLDPPPDTDALREAKQRMQDPERRIIDEFFWFWPHQLGQGKNDEALAALSRNDLKAAREIWIRQEMSSSEANVSMHNLAVLAHVAALDLEYTQSLNNNLTKDEVKKCGYHWAEAFKRWKILLQHEGFWSRLSARIRQLEDPRLTTGTARRIQASLPLALLVINAQLAIRAAECSATAEAERHMRIMKESGFEMSVVDEALQYAVKPIRERIKTLCQSIEADAEADPMHADQTTTKLLDQARPLLGVLDHLLPSNHPLRDGAHDEIALQALSCQISFGNKTENWKTSLKLLELMKNIAASQAAQDRIKENLTIVQANLDYQLLDGTCWFCKERPREEQAKVEIKMYGDITHTPTTWGTRIEWRCATITVPRCDECKRVHERIDSFTTIGGFLGAFAGLGGCITVLKINEDVWFGGLIVLGVSIAIGAAIGYGIARVKGVKPHSAHTEFPRVQELKREGWEFGEKPQVDQ